MSVSRLLVIALVTMLVPLSGCFDDGGSEKKDDVAEEQTALPVLAPPPLSEVVFAAASCEQAALLVPVDAERVAAYLPDGYAVYRDDSGVAWFGASFTHCPSFVKDGSYVRDDLHLAEAGIIIASPDGTGGIHVYQFLTTTDADRLGRDLGLLGAAGGHLEATAYAPEGVLPVGGHNGAAPWPGLSVSFEATAAQAVAPTPGIDRITWWHEGPDATVRIAYAYSAVSAAPAQGVVTVEEGSPFSDMFGATEADAGGFLFAHRFEATAAHHVAGT
ncbi:MAG: hypothetical protein KY455_12470 [Euryarchaeota archaeon]|nr:hypothetical protein [Euryarchaeota archaeon]